VLVAGAHVDSQAVVFGVGAVVVLFGGCASPGGPCGPPWPGWGRAGVAGVLVGLGFAVKVTVALVGVGLVIGLVLVLRGQWQRLVALGAGFAVTAGAAVAIGGSAMLKQSSRASDMVSIGSPWRVIRSLLHLVAGETVTTDIVRFGAIALAVVLAVLIIRGLPGILPGRDPETGDQAGRDVGGRDVGGRDVGGRDVGAGGRGADPGGLGYAVAGVAFALVLAWLFAWPYVLPWYDALGWALLPLIPMVSAPVVDGIGWLLLARTAALGFGYLPARATDARLPPGLTWLQPVIRHGVTPAVLAAATVWLVVLMVRSGHRRPDPDDPRAPGNSADPRTAATKAG
jgi:Glycosyltransferase family 87